MTKMTPYLSIPGTYVPYAPLDSHEWWHRGSDFDHLMRGCGFDRVERDGDPCKLDLPFWSRAVNGTLWQQLIKRSEKHDAWKEGAQRWVNFICYYRRMFEERGLAIAAHSHGGQMAAYLVDKLRGKITFPIYLITLDVPVRRDMQGVYVDAWTNTDHWLHFHSGWGWSSRFRVLGSRFNTPKLDVADENIPIKGGHSAFLTNHDYMRDLVPHLRSLKGRTI